MNLDQLLPSNLLVINADKHLYRNGLSFTAISDEKRRNVLFKPIIIFTVLMVFEIKTIILIQIRDNNNSYLHIILGDFGLFLGNSMVINSASLFFFAVTIFTQLIYFYCHKTNTKITFVKMFQMLSGSITPKSIGLTNEKAVLTLIRRSRIIFRVIQFIIPLALAFAMVNYFTPLAMNFSITEVILFAIPNTILMSMAVYHGFSFLVYQMVYLYLICYYLKSKIRAIDRQVIQSIQLSRYQNLRQIIQNYYQIYSEINEYNTTFWSKYLFVFWLLFGAIIVLALIAIFNDLAIVITLGLCLLTIYMAIIFCMVIFNTSSVNSVANNSYKVLIKLYIHYSGVERRNVCNKTKVYLFDNDEHDVFSQIFRSLIYWKVWLKKELDFLFGSYSQLITSDAMV